MKRTLEIWRESEGVHGHFERYTLENLNPAMSILDVLDRLNEDLIRAGSEAIAFESDCREGICGACGMTVNGRPHGPQSNTPACQQRLRDFDNRIIRLEPLRSAALPVLRDLVVDRRALDRVIIAGGYVGINVGTAPDADTERVGHDVVEETLDFAACIGCGACVAACPNGSAQLFVGAKLAHLARVPQAHNDRTRRAIALVEEAELLFGPCSNYGECAQVCPARIPLAAVAAVNKERLRAACARRVRRSAGSA